MIEPGELFFRCGSMVASAHSLKLIRIPAGDKHRKAVGEGRVGWSRGVEAVIRPLTDRLEHPNAGLKRARIGA